MTVISDTPINDCQKNYYVYASPVTLIYKWCETYMSDILHYSQPSLCGYHKDWTYCNCISSLSINHKFKANFYNFCLLAGKVFDLTKKT